MSRFADEAALAYGRWQQLNPGLPMPVVRVVLLSGAGYCFNGLAIAPAGVSPSAVSVSSAGLDARTLVVRHADTYTIEIQAVGL